MISALSRGKKSVVRCLGLLGLVASLTLAVGLAWAGEKKARPFHAEATATWDNVFNGLFAPPANFEGSGTATHLGDITQSGTLFLAPPDANFVFPGYGSVTFVAANGDSVSFDYEGFLNAVTGEGTGTFTFTGGTGRFAGATGSGTFDALIDLSFATEQPMTVTLDGSISY
jgi:hypothetical protein